MLFLLAVLLGAALGVLYDCFRVLRIVFPPAARAGAAAAEDIIFWLLYGFCVFCYAAVLGRGQVRFFMVFGSLMGFVLYILTIGNLITGIIRSIVTAVYGILHKVYYITIKPVVKILRNICQKISGVFVRSHKNFPKYKISLKNLLKNTAAMVYNKKTE